MRLRQTETKFEKYRFFLFFLIIKNVIFFKPCISKITPVDKVQLFILQCTYLKLSQLDCCYLTCKYIYIYIYLFIYLFIKLTYCDHPNKIVEHHDLRIKKIWIQPK